jgi:hypothetical protein
MPTIQQVHPPEFLTNLSLALMNENFIGQIIAPPIPVSRWVDRIPVYDNGTFMSAPTPADARRNPMSPALTTQYSITYKDYHCVPYALSTPVSDAIRTNEDLPLDVDTDAAVSVVNKLSIINEQLVSALVGTTANYPTGGQSLLTDSATVGTSWTNYNSAASNPFLNIITARNAVRKNIMRSPNTLFLTLDMSQVFSQHPLYKDWIKYTSADAINNSGIAKSINGLEVVVGNQQNNPSQGEDNTPFARTDVWKDSNGYNMAIVYYRDTSTGIRSVSSFRTFDGPDETTGSTGIQVRKYRRESLRADIVEASFVRDYQALTTDSNGLVLGAYIISDPGAIYN